MDLSARQQRGIAVVVVIVLVVALGSVVAVALGVGPFDDPAAGDGAGQGGTSATPPATGTVYTQGAGGTGDADQPPFSFAIAKIEQCGRTCRDVTVELANNQNETASDVTVYTRMYAGNNTKSNNRIWRGEEDVGTMAPGGTTTRTKRVKLSTTEAFKVKRKGGWITIVTTVKSSETTITFQERRDVA